MQEMKLAGPCLIGENPQDVARRAQRRSRIPILRFARTPRPVADLDFNHARVGSLAPDEELTTDEHAV